MKIATLLIAPLALLMLVASAHAEDPKVPPDSADYAKMLALGVRYKKGEITFEQLKKEVVVAKLPPHALGDLYLDMRPPPPPPGMEFTPNNMPKDWEKTFGEVYMVMVRGQITEDEYKKLHAAAHSKLAGYPNCGKKK